jgi:hypothetical protein
MNNSNSRIERLKQMLVFEEKRVELQGELDSILRQISVLKDQVLNEAKITSTAEPIASALPRSTPARRQKRGLLRDKVLAALEAAGNAGVRVKELALAIGTNPVNIHSWFHSALKRNEPIEKITGGHYRLGGKGSAKSEKTSAPVTKSKPRRGRAKRGKLTAQILEELKAAGSAGITVADLSAKLGAEYKNIYIWFATTGKKNAAVKKVGPAKFKFSA